MTTRRGELSVRVDSWTCLAEARRPFPDKWHGISDTDTGSATVRRLVGVA